MAIETQADLVEIKAMAMAFNLVIDSTRGADISIPKVHLKKMMDGLADAAEQIFNLKKEIEELKAKATLNAPH